jgi:hypothetical protein
MEKDLFLKISFQIVEVILCYLKGSGSFIIKDVVE